MTIAVGLGLLSDFTHKGGAEAITWSGRQNHGCGCGIVTEADGDGRDTKDIEKTFRYSVMQASLFSFQSLEQLVDKIFTTRRISRMDQELLMALLNKEVIEPQEHDLVNRVFQGLQQGRLRVA